MARAQQRFVEKTLVEALQHARELCEDLAGELEEWHDNLPESLQEGDKGSVIQECMDSFNDFVENIDSMQHDLENGKESGVDLDEADRLDYTLSTKKSMTKREKAQNIVTILESVREMARFTGEEDPTPREGTEQNGWEILVGELDEVIDNIESMEWP